MKFNSLWNNATQWFTSTPERALEQAYRAAEKIKDIEEKHFQGQKVSTASGQYGASVIAYFTTEVKRYLQKINVNLAIFKTSRLFLNLAEIENSPTDKHLYGDDVVYILDKLKFIDQTIERYSNLAIEHERQNPLISSVKTAPNPNLLNETVAQKKSPREIQRKSLFYGQQTDQKLDSASRKTGVLPRSFLRTVNRIRQELDPQTGETERQVLNQYRTSRYKTAISIKFILMLIIIPLLTHQLTKTFLLSPAVESYFNQHQEIVFINQSLEREAFEELQSFEDSLRFRSLIGLSPKLSEQETESRLREKAAEISEAYRNVGANAIANIFADMFSLIAFSIVLITSRQEIEIVKGFIDEIVYGLSDSAKAFLIILFTDMFVGFHSPHGWEVILENVARHFGLPENRDFNFLFIATFPVILDTVFKYWIFRYLNGISPSSVATYRNMNE
ncbi:MAG: proton extrusion protein PcxA [Snowella sp.]|nr:proton extrusion protein PcxA [Snowella sp.]